MIRRRDQRGFTIIELMVATTVFTVIMATVAAMLVQYSNSQRKAVNETAAQNVARDVIDRVSQSLQFEGRAGSVTALSSTDNTVGYCIGTTRYSVALGRQVMSAATHAAMVDRSGIGCGGTAQPVRTATSGLAGTELMASQMRMANFDITSPQAGLYTVTVRVVFGATDLLCSQSASVSCDQGNEETSTVFDGKDIPADTECKAGKDGRFCAVSELATTVRSRL